MGEGCFHRFVEETKHPLAIEPAVGQERFSVRRFNQRTALDHDGNIDLLAVECGPETIESGIGLGDVQHAFAGAQAVGQILGGYGICSSSVW